MQNSKCHVSGNLEWLKFTFVSLNLNIIVSDLSFDQIETQFSQGTRERGGRITKKRTCQLTHCPLRNLKK